MKKRRILYSFSILFLVVAASSAFLASRPMEHGVRLPVHAADGRIGYIDDRGWMVIPPVWRSATRFGPDDTAVVSVVDQPGGIKALYQRWIQQRVSFPRTSYYRINRSGHQTPIPHPLPAAWDPGTEAAPPGGIKLTHRGSGRLWTLADGTPAFPGSWQDAKDFQGDDPAAVLEDRRWGFINRKGETINLYRWDHTLGFSGNGRAPVAIGRKWGLIDREGRLVVPLRFKTLSGFDAAGLCAAEIASGWGFIDAGGKIAVPFRYRKAEPFDRFGMAKVQLGGNHSDSLCGWINREGKSLIEVRYEVTGPLWAENFKDHELLPVVESGKAGLIDRTGKTVIDAARGELGITTDPVALDRYWITTLPHRSVLSAHGDPRLPFEPSCHDSSGNPVWNGSTITRRQLQVVTASVCGIICAFLFVIGRRQPQSPVPG